MFIIKAETIIHANPLRVWEAIIDFDRYDHWNSQLAYLGGAVEPNGWLHLRLSPPGSTPYEFKPQIIVWKENQEFAWIARTGFKGVFDGAHHFVLEDLKDGTTKLLNYERYSGLLAPIMERLPMMKGAAAGFIKMNEELKRYIEQ